MDQSKTVEVRMMQLSPLSSPMTLVDLKYITLLYRCTTEHSDFANIERQQILGEVVCFISAILAAYLGM